MPDSGNVWPSGVVTSEVMGKNFLTFDHKVIEV